MTQSTQKNQLDMLTLRKRTQNKNAEIRNNGFNLVEVYECDLKEKQRVPKFLKDVE